MAPSATSLSPSCLRLGTFNVGLGFTRKLPTILSRATALQLDVLALQEIGDPAILPSRLSSHILVAAVGPSQQQAGVALLIARELAPRCRTYFRSKGGRLIGAVLELAKGRRTLLVSAYMPTGLDHCSAGNSAIAEAHQLYSELTEWTRGMSSVIVLGDLNQTLTQFDRHPRPAAPPPAASAAGHSPIHHLMQQGFLDSIVDCILMQPLSQASHTSSTGLASPCAVGSTTSGREDLLLQMC